MNRRQFLKLSAAAGVSTLVPWNVSLRGVPGVIVPQAFARGPIAGANVIDRLKVLTYNTHLFKDSAVAFGSIFKGRLTWRSAQVSEDKGVVDSAPAVVVHAGQPHVYWKHRDGSLWETYYGDGKWRNAQASVEAGVVDSAPAAVVHAGQPHVYWKHRDGSLWDTYFNGCGYLSSQLSAEGGVDSFYGKIRLGISHAGTEDIGLQQNYRQIANETVMDDLPAIMMGDFNANPKTGLYEIMNNVFQRVGAVDAYVEVHGPDPNMERRENTANLGENTLQQIFSSWATADHIAHAEANPLDLVYVKQSGSSGLKLVPVDARVPRDWTYPSPGLGGEEIDLSDHFPLMVEFSVREA